MIRLKILIISVYFIYTECIKMPGFKRFLSIVPYTPSSAQPEEDEDVCSICLCGFEDSTNTDESKQLSLDYVKTLQLTGVEKSDKKIIVEGDNVKFTCCGKKLHPECAALHISNKTPTSFTEVSCPMCKCDYKSEKIARLETSANLKRIVEMKEKHVAVRSDDAHRRAKMLKLNNCRVTCCLCSNSVVGAASCFAFVSACCNMNCSLGCPALCCLSIVGGFTEPRIRSSFKNTLKGIERGRYDENGMPCYLCYEDPVFSGCMPKVFAKPGLIQMERGGEQHVPSPNDFSSIDDLPQDEVPQDVLPQDELSQQEVPQDEFPTSEA